MSRTEFAISLKLLDEKFKKGMKGVKNQLSNFKSWIASAFAVGSILDFAKSIASVGSAFQSQMARVKAVSGATKEEFKAMSDEAKRLGASTKYSSQQAAEALEYLTRNGLKAKDATEALKHVLKLASSQAIELSQAADIATTVMNAFGLEVKDLTKVNDVLAATTSNSATNITDLSEALKVAAPIAKTLNIGIEETNAALGVLANNGYRGSQAGTALRIILSRISSQTPKAAEALKRYGLTLSEADLKADGLLETLRKLSNVNIDFSDLTTIFGQEAAAPISALLSNIGNLKDLKITLDTSQGEASRQAVEGEGNYEKALNELKSTWDSFLEGIFSKTEGIFTGIINGAKTVVEELKKWSTWIATGFAAIGVVLSRKFRETSISISDSIKKSRAELISSAGKKVVGVASQNAISNEKTSTQSINKLKGAYSSILDVLTKIDYLDSKESKLLKNFADNTKGLIVSLENLQKYKKKVSEIDTTLEIGQERKQELENLISLGGSPEELKTYQDLLDQVNDSIKEGSQAKLNLEREINNEKKFQLEVQKEINKAAGLDTKKLKKLSEKEIVLELDRQNKELEKQHSWLNQIKATGKGIWNNFKSIGSSILNFFGGWIGIAITAIPMVISFFKSWYDEQNKVFKAIDDNFDKVTSDVSTMETEVVSLVNIMKKHNKESAEWKAAYDALNSTFPDIAKQLNLEAIYVNNASLAYRNLQDEINGAIKKRKEYLLQEAKIKSTSDLLKDYQEKTNKLGEDLVKLLTDSGQTETAAKILVSGLRDEILQILRSDSETKQKDLVDRLGQFFADNKISNPRRSYQQTVDNYGNISYVKDGESLSEKFANKFFSRFSKYQRELDSLDLISRKADTSTFEEIKNRIRNLVSSSMSFGVSRETEIALKEGAMGRNEYQENESVLASYRKILEDLVDSLIKIKEPIDKQGTTALEFAKTLPDYKGIEAKINATLKKLKVLADTAESDPSSIYDTAIKYLDKLFKEGLIKGEVEYNRKKLEAINTYISSLENLKKTDDETISTLKNLNKEREALTKAIEAGVRAEEENKKNIKERQQKLEQISEGRKNAALSSANMKYNKWDSFNFSDKFEYENQFPEKEYELALAQNYLSQYENIAGEKWKILDEISKLQKELKLNQKLGIETDSITNLIKSYQDLIAQIEKSEKAVENLNDAIQFKKAIKEIQDMEKERFPMVYDTIKNGTQGLDSIVNSWKNLFESWNEADFGENLSNIISSAFGSIDTVMSFLDALKQVTEFFELIGLKKQALAAIEAGTTSTTIANTQAEAAAVVAAEAEKTAAITGSIAAQTTANLAAKTLQTKAATIAMAAESTAAYAAIPFAGVGLAAAQIAEMEGLIAAAAAMPAFAEGGIVGGSKYIGDQNLARVNSGEMIINGSQQKKLWNAISNNRLGDSMSGNVEFIISGQVLKGVLVNHEKKMGKLKS